MLSQQDIEGIAKYEKAFKMWEHDRIFAGFGHEGIAMVSNIYRKLFNSTPNMSCSACAMQTVEAVYREYKKLKDAPETHS